MKRFFILVRFIWRHPLASKNRRLAFSKFLRFQFSQRIAPFPVWYPLVENSTLLVKRGMVGATGNIYTGLLEFVDMAFVLHVLRSEDIFVDIGANVGVYTILASKNAGARVLSIEPIASSYLTLRNNVFLNEVDHLVTLHPIGVGEEPGILSFTNSMDAINHVLVADEECDFNNSVLVEVKSIDEIVEGNEPVIIKMDIEGFEWTALKGAKKLLDGNILKCLIIELNGSGIKYGANEDDIHDLLLSHRFLPFRYDPFLRQLTPMEKYGRFNTIYIRDKDWAVDRVKNAKKFIILDQFV
ncbi:MAG: FkbM family methyltransferase [Ferruginibacter sp.]